VWCSGWPCVCRLGESGPPVCAGVAGGLWADTVGPESVVVGMST
jgi:hypothetical protein